MDIVTRLQVNMEIVNRVQVNIEIVTRVQVNMDIVTRLLAKMKILVGSPLFKIPLLILQVILVHYKIISHGK